MKSKVLLIIIFSAFFHLASFAQEEEILEKDSKKENRKKEAVYKPLDPVAPSRAAFYTTIVPIWDRFTTKNIGKFPWYMLELVFPFTFGRTTNAITTATATNIKIACKVR